jgi:hypothetical protein
LKKPWTHIRNSLEDYGLTDNHGMFFFKESVQYFYPKEYAARGLGSLREIGYGYDSAVFTFGNSNGTRVCKLTRNRADARVLNTLFKENISHPNVVKVHYVAFLPKLDLWYVEEERLRSVDVETPLAACIEHVLDTCVEHVLDSGRGMRLPRATLSKVENQVDQIRIFARELGITQMSVDCLTLHNLMLDRKKQVLKVSDFGYTAYKGVEDYIIW